jgi:ligand-binding SRPBCC domain-containing protein
MRMIRFERVQRLGIHIDAAWEFISRPANLALITPPDVKFTLISPLPKQMHPGMIATYTITPFRGIRCRWMTEITQVAHPFLFVDEQRFGPYRFWHHQHHFKETDGGVEMRDIIHYMLPFDPFSRPFSGLVARRLEYIFDFRRDALNRMFGMSYLKKENP